MPILWTIKKEGPDPRGVRFKTRREAFKAALDVDYASGHFCQVESGPDMTTFACKEHAQAAYDEEGERCLDAMPKTCRDAAMRFRSAVSGSYTEQAREYRAIAKVLMMFADQPTPQALLDEYDWSRGLRDR